MKAFKEWEGGFNIAFILRLQINIFTAQNIWRVVDSFQFSSLKNLPENLCQSEKFVWNRKLIFTPSGYIFLDGTHFRLVSASSDIRILLTSDALELIAFSRIWVGGCEPGELLLNYSVEFVYRKTLRFQFRIEEVKECPLESSVQKDLLFWFNSFL